MKHCDKFEKKKKEQKKGSAQQDIIFDNKRDISKSSVLSLW